MRNVRNKNDSFYKKPDSYKETNVIRNLGAFVDRYSLAIEKNINTDKKTSIIRRACELLKRFDIYVQKEIIRKWCSEFSLSEKILTAYLNGTDYKLSNSDVLREKLLEYEILENAITGQVTISKDGVKKELAELKYEVSELGFKIGNIDLFLNSKNTSITVVKKINPLETFFRELAENYDRSNPIKQLASFIPAYDFGDKEQGYYQKKLEYYLKKWLCKAVGQVLGIASNDAMLLWVEPIGGSGKSRFNKWIFNIPEFLNYYVRLGEIESFIDMKGISKAKFAIDWDELPLTLNKYRMFKSHTASDGGQVYVKKKGYENYERQVNFIGSTNYANRERQPGFLLDDDDAMKRRIISLELDGRMNYAEYTKIDIYQIWAQAAWEIMKAQKSNDKDFLTWEIDYPELRERNARYVWNKKTEHNSDKQIFLKTFKPAPYKEGRILSASSMKKELERQGIKIDMSPEQIGRFLIKNYVAGRVGDYKGYYIL